ncbi:hypothetical protein T265_12617, partial [Opisthorchis viverrini]
MSSDNNSPARLRIKVAGEVLEKHIVGPLRSADNEMAACTVEDVDRNAHDIGCAGDSSDQQYPAHSMPTSHPVEHHDQEQGPFCVFCGLNAQVKFGQGELRRFHTNEEPVPVPSWYKELMASMSEKQSATHVASLSNRQQVSRKSQHNRAITITPPPVVANFESRRVGPYASLDGCRRLKEHKNIGSDGKPCLPGLPNAFFDCEGRPFGLVEELGYIGWPVAPDGEESLQLQHVISSCSPREGGEGSWIFAHHCCASWSTGVHFNEQ